MSFWIIHSKEKRREAAEAIMQLTGDPLYCVSISLWEPTRTDAQNKLYHVWVSILANELGYTHDNMHETLARELLGQEVKEVNGKNYIYVKSTRNLSVKQFTQYMNMIENLGNFLGISLPVTNEHGALSR